VSIPGQCNARRRGRGSGLPDQISRGLVEGRSRSAGFRPRRDKGLIVHLPPLAALPTVDPNRRLSLPADRGWTYRNRSILCRPSGFAPVHDPGCPSIRERAALRGRDRRRCENLLPSNCRREKLVKLIAQVSRKVPESPVGSGRNRELCPPEVPFHLHRRYSFAVCR